MPGAALRLTEMTAMAAKAAMPLAMATDCDFRPSGFADDPAMLDAAGIRRVVVDFAQRLTFAQGRWRGSVRCVIDSEALAAGDDLQGLHDHGVRGVRFALDRASDAEKLCHLADRLVALDWHIEIDAALGTGVLAAAEWTLMQMPVALSFANCGGYDPRLPLDHPDVALLFELVRIGRGWVKLSDASLAPAGDFKPFVDALLRRRRDRIVWGSGVRHERRPAGIAAFVDNTLDRQMILSHNPARLYGFD